jgi:hypothetical protein
LKLSTVVAGGENEIANLQKEFLLFRYSVEKRLQALEKTFRLLKNRNILKEVSYFFSIILITLILI